MNAGTKYLMDSVAGLVVEVANLRSLVEAKDARIAELEKLVPKPAPEPVPAEAM